MTSICKATALSLTLFLTSTDGFSPQLIPKRVLLRTKSATIGRRSNALSSIAQSGETWEGDRTDVESSAVKNTLFEPLGVGVQRDFSSRLPQYKSDFVDGLNAQSLATVLFLFFACLAPAIGFGGILQTATAGEIGAIEMMVSTAVCGVLYALLAPQPMQLIGPMGPNLAYTISLHYVASRFALPFLPFYAWTGLWTAGMLMLAALTSASNLVKHLTKFTDEIFSVLISTIFIIEAITNVAKTFASPVEASKALLTLICATITFSSATILKGCKSSNYLTKRIRNLLSNFAPALGVLFGSVVARWARLRYGNAAAELPILALPTKFCTTSGRPWMVPLLALPNWARWASALPALLATVLLFLDQNITARLVNNPRYKMCKGRRANVLDGMHGDMFVLSLLTAGTSIVGLPWMAGATTRSAAHVRALSITNSKGETSGTLENRVSGAAIHWLIGACVLYALPRQVLSQVPLAVLDGVFLYLGFQSLQGLELWDRIQGLFQESSAYARTRWSMVDRNITSMYTLVQIACVAVMMKVTKSSVGVISPLLIGVLPLLRLGLIKLRLIQKGDMEVLDREEDT